MAKSKKPKKAHKAKTKPTKKAGKPAAKKARAKESPAGRTTKNTGASGGEATAGEGAGDESKALPNNQITVGEVATLQTVNEQFSRTVVDSSRDQLQEHEGRLAQLAVPVPPSPTEEALAAQSEILSSIVARLSRIEASLQQPSRDLHLDAPASVDILKQRKFFAGACKTLDIHQPTPAIIGRIMHDKRMFSPSEHKSPRSLFEAIYAKPNTPNHLSKKIRDLLSKYGNQTTQAGNAAETADPLASGHERRGKSAGKVSSSVAKELGPEFDMRFDLIENFSFGVREPVKSGGQTKYCRYLTQDGREVFDNWPEWTDATGGIGLVDEQPSQPTSSDATGRSVTPTLPRPPIPGPSPPPSAT